LLEDDPFELAPEFPGEEHDVMLWHRCLGHLSLRGAKTAVPVVTGMKLHTRSPDFCVCEACILGKLFRQPFKRIDKLNATTRLQVAHSDVMGPVRTTNMSGKRYAIYESTKYVTVYFMASKSEAPAMFGKYKAEVENKCNTNIKRIMVDGEENIPPPSSSNFWSLRESER
jgi:hypothetical protein